MKKKKKPFNEILSLANKAEWWSLTYSLFECLQRLLGQILNCYIQQCGLRLDGCYLVYKKIPSCLDPIQSSSIGLFSSVSSNSVQLFSTPLWSYKMNASCVHPTVCGDCQVSTNIVSFGQVQLLSSITNLLLPMMGIARKDL